MSEADQDQGVWDRGEDENPYHEEYLASLEGVWDTGDEETIDPPPGQKKRPRWQKQFAEHDYQHFLLTAQSRTDYEKLQKTLAEIKSRLLVASQVDVIPPKNRPTNVARSEFIDVPHASLLTARVNAIQGIVNHYGVEREDGHYLKYRKVEFESLDRKNRESKDNDAVAFSARTDFEEATIRLRETNDHRFSVRVHFRKDPGEEPVTYESGFVPTQNLTQEEVGILARHALEVGFFNLYSDPEKSPYPWELPQADPTQFQ